jgi:WD40 repeat protein
MLLLISGIAWSSRDPSVFASLSYDGRVCELNCNTKEHNFLELSVVLFYFHYFPSHNVVVMVTLIYSGGCGIDQTLHTEEVKAML